MVDNRLWIWGRTHFSRTWMVQCREIFKIIRSPKNLNGGIWWLCSACSCKPSIRRSTGQSPHSQASVSGPRTWFRAFERRGSGPLQGQSSLLPLGSWYLHRVHHWSSQLQKRAYRMDLHFSNWSCHGISVARAWELPTRCPCIGRWILSHSLSPIQKVTPKLFEYCRTMITYKQEAYTSATWCLRCHELFWFADLRLTQGCQTQSGTLCLQIDHIRGSCTKRNS